MIKFHVTILYTFQEINRQRAFRSGPVVLVHRFKRFSKSDFLKILELSECRRDDPYITAYMGRLASLTRNKHVWRVGQRGCYEGDVEVSLDKALGDKS